MEEQLEDVAQMKEQQTTITRVVSICEDGECRLETMSLTPQGWVDYMRTYPVSGSMISNLELEELFTFTKLDSCWYTDEVKKFLNTEKTHFISYDLLSSEYDGSLYSEDFVMFYLEYRDGIKLLFSNQKDDIEVEMVLKGAKNAKTVNSSPNTYLVFEDCNGYLKAIDENMIIYRLSRKSNTK